MSFSACPNGWTPNGASCYKFETSRQQSWDNARSACLAMSADLVSIGNAQEQAFIVSEARKHDEDQFWIGFNDKRVEGKFEWSNGSPATYTYWNSGEPNNLYNEDCAELDKHKRYKWNDLRCTHALFFICERARGKEKLINCYDHQFISWVVSKEKQSRWQHLFRKSSPITPSFLFYD